MTSTHDYNYKKEISAGLKSGNLDEIDNKFICGSCKLILLDPYQLLCCGTLVCKWCFKKRLSNSEPFICPLCKTKQIKKEGLPDRGAERELKIIFIVCYSCPWDGSYKDYLIHLQEKHSDLECADCHERFFAINLFEEHRQEICIHRSLPCGLPGCLDSIKWNEMLSHYLSDKHQHTLLLLISEYFKRNNPQLQKQQRFEIMDKEVNDLRESTEITLSACEILANDVARLKDDESHIKTNLEENTPEIDKLKKQNTENENRVKELLDNSDRIEEDLRTIKNASEDDQIQILDTNSTTTLIFNLPNNPSFSLISSKIKTSKYGYVFMVRVCSTTISDKEYLSIFLTLCNSDYNNLIPYPFSYAVHFILCDQSSEQKHIEYILKPDPTSPAFARPTSEMNDEYGISQFCLLKDLTDKQSIYVKDGTFFIRIFIDFFGTGQNPFRPKDNTEILTTTTMVTE
jgi:hypothetical protein